MTLQTIIRPFEQNDTAAIVELWHQCQLTRPWNDPHKDIKRKCSVRDDLFLVAIHNEKQVGSVMGGYEGHRGWINYLAVSPEYRKQGLGRQLMEAVESRLLALGCPKINLQIRQDNHEIISFYQSLGFTDDHSTSLGKRLISDH
jgi:ribosomal protein S18 acetylase RimI-like enzyme